MDSDGANANTVNGYVKLGKIGKGSYGKIYKVSRDGHILALKRVDMTNLSPQEQTDTLNEVSLMAQLDNEHIVRFYDAFMDNNSMYIAMELLSGGDLGHIIHKAQKQNVLIEEETVWQFLVECCCGLKYLHDRRMLHRDLKPQNIMLDAEGHVKLVDFGFTKLLAANQLAMSVVGTPLYMSPELLQKQGYDDRTDVWSLGCIFYELLTLAPPFGGRSWEELTSNILNKVPPSPSTEKYSSELRTVISRMLIKDPKMRPSIRDIMKMPEFMPNFLKYKEIDPLEEDQVEIWHELTRGISPQITGTRVMAAQFTWFVRKLAESRRDCRNLKEQLATANAKIETLTAQLAASKPRESIGEDLGDSKDEHRPKNVLFRKEVSADSSSDSSSESDSESDESERVTTMMSNMTLGTPQTQTTAQQHTAAAPQDKRLTSTAAAASTSVASTPVKAPKGHSKLIPYAADHFGLVPMLPPDATISALYAWQKQDKPADKRIRTSPVWGNKDTFSLLVPTANILIMVRVQTQSSSSKKLYLKHLYAGYAGEASLSRVDFSPDDTRLLPVADRNTWYFISFKGKSEIKDLRLEFESHNMATEIIVLRSAKLLDIISRREKELGSASQAGVPSTTASSSKLAASSNKTSGGDTITDMTSLDKLQEEFLQTTHLLDETKYRTKTSSGGN